MTICNICNRPQHELRKVGNDVLVACPEMTKGRVVFTDNYKCSCCKCKPPAEKPITPAASTVWGKRMSEAKAEAEANDWPEVVE